MNFELIVQVLGAGGLGAAIVGGLFMRKKSNAEAEMIKTTADIKVGEFMRTITEDLRAEIKKSQETITELQAKTRKLQLELGEALSENKRLQAIIKRLEEKIKKFSNE